MYLRTWSAGTCIAHLPEVVVLVAVDDMVGRHVLGPEAGGLVVALQSLFLASLEDRHVHVFRVKVQHVNKILPCHVYGTFLEVVAEAPVAQHLEHGMVIGVVSHLLKVVMLSAYAQALL